MYDYECKLVRVLDGNTIEADIDLGFNITIRQRVRLFGVESPSLQGATEEIRESARASRDNLLAILPETFIVETIIKKRGKFGRIMGTLYTLNADESRTCINDSLIENGFAKRHEAKAA
jgi:micrococcal nuclease